MGNSFLFWIAAFKIVYCNLVYNPVVCNKMSTFLNKFRKIYFVNQGAGGRGQNLGKTSGFLHCEAILHGKTQWKCKNSVWEKRDVETCQSLGVTQYISFSPLQPLSYSNMNIAIMKYKKKWRYSLSISSSFSHYLSIFSQPGCQNFWKPACMLDL